MPPKSNYHSLNHHSTKFCLLLEQAQLKVKSEVMVLDLFVRSGSLSIPYKGEGGNFKHGMGEHEKKTKLFLRCNFSLENCLPIYFLCSGVLGQEIKSFMENGVRKEESGNWWDGDTQLIYFSVWVCVHVPICLPTYRILSSANGRLLSCPAAKKLMYISPGGLYWQQI